MILKRTVALGAVALVWLILFVCFRALSVVFFQHGEQAVTGAAGVLGLSYLVIALLVIRSRNL